MATHPLGAIHGCHPRTRRGERPSRESLIPELAGVLNWALEGLSAYREQSLNPPAAVRAATDDYRDDMDIIGQWIEERCVKDPASVLPTGILHADYQTWAMKEAGFALSAARFGRDLVGRGYAGVKGTGGRRQVKGLRLKTANGGGCPLLKN